MLCARHFAHQQTRALRARRQTREKVTVHAAIDHRQSQAVLPRQHADRCAAGQKVFYHLPTHIRRKSRYALRCEPVVGSKHHHLRMFQHRLVSAQNSADLYRQCFDPAE